MAARLRYESPDAAEILLRGYDRVNGTWSFPRVGDFWGTVAEAHRRGTRGAGKRIAIADSGFDLSIPALAAASEGKLAMADRGGARGHGTTVALLALTVAPEAALDLYPIAVAAGPDEYAVAEALKRIARSAAVSVCLSLGAPVPRREVKVGQSEESKWEAYAKGARWPALRPATCPFPEACLCDAADAVASPARTVCAAVGNEEEGDGDCEFCPALGDRVVSVGFQFERRRLEGNADTAWATPPQGYEQSDYVKVTFMQPEGALGSSFATPLMAGAAALDVDAAALPAMAISAQLGALADQRLARIRLPHQAGPNESEALVDEYLSAIAVNPHVRDLLEGDHWCTGCALFGLTLFTNAGLAMFGQGRLAEAERLSRIARGLGPHNPHAAANLGATLLARAEMEGDGDGLLTEEARTLYADAARLGARVVAPR
jgi:hypothetical protein